MKKEIEKGGKMDKLIGQFDATVWAEEFIKTVKEKPDIATDIDTMRGWFANSIMAGYDKAKNEDRAKLLEAVGVDRIHKMIEKYDDSCGEDYDNSELALALNKEIVKAIK